MEARGQAWLADTIEVRQPCCRGVAPVSEKGSTSLHMYAGPAAPALWKTARPCPSRRARCTTALPGPTTCGAAVAAAASPASTFRSPCMTLLWSGRRAPTVGSDAWHRGPISDLRGSPATNHPPILWANSPITTTHHPCTIHHHNHHHQGGGRCRKARLSALARLPAAPGCRAPSPTAPPSPCAPQAAQS